MTTEAKYIIITAVHTVATGSGNVNGNVIKSLKRNLTKFFKITFINVSLIKHEGGIRGLSPRRRKVTRNANSVSLFVKSSAFQTVPSSHFSNLREERQACTERERNEGWRDRIWTGRVKVTEQLCSITGKQNGTKWVNKIKF
jgi:hypothetical protein